MISDSASMVVTSPAPLAMPRLFAELPAVFASDFVPSAPWELLGIPLDEFLAHLPSESIEIQLPPDIHLLGDKIRIGRGTTIQPGAVIEGPIWIGENVEIRPGAYLRGGCYVGNGSVVGTHTEVKRAILLAGAKAPHQNYVGDSILGAGVNLGAGTILSNFRHDGGEIHLSVGLGRIPTGRRKLGAILGDGVATGCNSVLHPGVIVGADTHLYPGVQLRSGIYPADSVIKLKQSVAVVPRR